MWELELPKRRQVQFLLIVLVVLLPLSALQVSQSEDGVTEDSWVSKTPMQEARRGLGVAVVNGKIYAMGGYPGSGNYLDTTEEYDPELDTWIFKAPMPTPMAYFGIAVYNDKVYCISGETGANEVYDPATDTWETRAPLPNPRIGIRANAVNGKIYVIGGESNITDVYDPATDSWITKAPMPFNLRLDMGWTCTSVVFDNKIHVIGAFPRANSHQIYDPATNNWIVGEPVVAGYFFASAGATSGVNAPKRIYVFGADRNLWTINAPTLTSQSYDPKTNSWTECTSIPSGHLIAGVAVLDDKLYVIGGGGAGYANAIYSNALNRLYTPIGYGTPDPSYQSPTPSPTPTLEPTPTSEPQQTEQFPTTWLITAIASVIVIGSGLIVYFWKRKKKLKFRRFWLNRLS
jgi:hypothetical protein